MEISHNTDSRISEKNLLDSYSNIKQDIVSIHQYLNSFDKQKYGENHDQLWAKNNMKTFCNEMKLKIVQCIVCLEAWPIKETKAVSKFYYMRCVQDKIIPHSLHRVPYQIHIKKLAKIACIEAYFTECFDKDR